MSSVALGGMVAGSMSPSSHTTWAVEASMGNQRIGIAAIDGAGDLWFANEFAVQCLRDYFGMATNGSLRMPPPLRTWSTTLHRQGIDHEVVILQGPTQRLVVRPIREMELHPFVILQFREYQVE